MPSRAMTTESASASASAGTTAASAASRRHAPRIGRRPAPTTAASSVRRRSLPRPRSVTGRTRRRQIRERLLLLEREEEELLAQEEELVAAEISEDESEYGTDSGDEGMFIALVKPIFIRKTQRVTIVERKRMEEVARQLEELLKKRMKECKIETRRIVVEDIRKELRINKIQSEESDIEIEVLTDDEENKAEYEAWMDREIKRDREEREARLREREEIQKVSNMTEEERSEWEWMNPKLLKQPKQKRRFMQKYYHKAFLLPGESC